ncbi:MAG: protein kinase domain-containing protein [Chthoniobacterales bacterium]
MPGDTTSLLAGTADARAERVAELVEAALELEAEERLRFLEKACAGDEQLHAEVQSLLNFQARAARFIEEPAYHLAAETLATDEGELKPGQELGEYRIKSLLGEGGMGEVYLAEDVQLGRTVAIKLIKSLVSRASLRRQFMQEERILAGLNHPHIARLYGGSMTPEGQPYFVMEYVAGERLDDFCGQQQLPVAARLVLFEKICSAVAYAHQQLVIHRDLKPGNIRVTPEGEPKLLDFGIARLLGDETQRPEQTITLAGMMTPDYASPEQVCGERMTTASDVYSLGVILYELLTGEKPYRLTSRRPDEIIRAITQQEPARPSTVAGNQKAKPKNQKSLRGDLDRIVLMAMRKEPARRYESARQLAEDIRRHLEGRPVRAQKPTWNYRAGKFIRRHKISLAAAVIVLGSLLAGIFTTAWEARRAEQQRTRAERRFQEVRQLARSLIFEIHDAIVDLPGSTPTRQLIVSRALEYLNSLAQEAGNDPSLLRELASAYVKIGNVQGNPNNSNLGDTAGAMESYGKAKRISEELLAAAPEDALARRSLGLVEEKMSDVQASLGDLPTAVATAQRSLAAFQATAQRHPGDVPAQQALAISHVKVGDVLGNPNLPNVGDTAGARKHYEAALAVLEALPRSIADDFKTRRFTGIAHERLGSIYETEGNLGDAERHYRASQGVRLEVAQKYPESMDAIRDVAIAHEKMANIMAAAGDLNGALAARQQSLATFRQLAASDPRNVYAQRSLAISHLHLADLLGSPDAPNLGRPQEAIVEYQAARQILSQHFDPADGSLQLVEKHLRVLQVTSPDK